MKASFVCFFSKPTKWDFLVNRFISHWRVHSFPLFPTHKVRTFSESFHFALKSSFVFFSKHRQSKVLVNRFISSENLINFVRLQILPSFLIQPCFLIRGKPRGLSAFHWLCEISYVAKKRRIADSAQSFNLAMVSYLYCVHFYGNFLFPQIVWNL